VVDPIPTFDEGNSLNAFGEHSRVPLLMKLSVKCMTKAQLLNKFFEGIRVRRYQRLEVCNHSYCVMPL